MATVGDFRYDAADLAPIASQMFGELGALWPLLAATTAQAIAALLVLTWGAKRIVAPFAAAASPMPLALTAVATIALALVAAGDPAGLSAKLWGVGGLLLVAVYLLAAQANSRLDDSSTIAWAFFALMGIALAGAVLLKGADAGWWPVGITVVVIAAAAAFAVKRPARPAPRPHQPR